MKEELNCEACQAMCPSKKDFDNQRLTMAFSNSLTIAFMSKSGGKETCLFFGRDGREVVLKWHTMQNLWQKKSAERYVGLKKSTKYKTLFVKKLNIGFVKNP